MIDAERLKHLAAARLSLGRAQCAETVRDVLLRGQVREERQILMYVADAPFPGGDVPLLLRVVQVFAAYGDAPFVRIGVPGNAIEQGGFSRARRAEENREAGQRAEMDIQVETALGIRKALADADFNVGGDWLWSLFLSLLVRLAARELSLLPPWTHRPWTPVCTVPVQTENDGQHDE